MNGRILGCNPSGPTAMIAKCHSLLKKCVRVVLWILPVIVIACWIRSYFTADDIRIGKMQIEPANRVCVSMIQLYSFEGEFSVRWEQIDDPDLRPFTN